MARKLYTYEFSERGEGATEMPVTSVNATSKRNAWMSLAKGLGRSESELKRELFVSGKVRKKMLSRRERMAVGRRMKRVFGFGDRRVGA